MFEVYYNEKKKTFEFKPSKQDVLEALYGFKIGVAYHTPDGGVNYLRFDECEIGEIMFIKPSFMRPGTVCFINKKRDSEIYIEANGTSYSANFKLYKKQYNAMHDFLISVVKEKGIKLFDQSW